ncbi:MAG TPA: hypothetical protein VGL53_12475 [Bryobacteraceae bacterium]
MPLFFLCCCAALADPILATNPAIPADLQLTTFASGLNFPYGLYQLPDGSILAATSNGGLLGSSLQIDRITQTNGIANTPTVVYNGGAGPATGLTGVGNIVAVATGTNTGSQIVLLQAGAGGSLTQIGQMTFNYPPGAWDHDSHAIAMQAVAGQPGEYQLIFSVGSQNNQTPSTDTVGITGLATATLNPDSIYSMTFSVSGSTVTPSAPTEVATGLRNAFALGFDSTGEIYFAENGIDFNNTNVPVSTDYLAVIPTGSGLLNFGFPNTYYDPNTGQMIGPGTGVTPPYVKFLPLDGMATQGAGGLAFAPSGFPAGLNDGVFVGFYGKHTDGAGNDLGGVVYVDLSTGQYFDFIPNAQDGIDHPVSFLSTPSALYIADLSTTGSDTQNGTGSIFEVSLLAVPEPGMGVLFATSIALVGCVAWRRGKSSLLRRV